MIDVEMGRRLSSVEARTMPTSRMPRDKLVSFRHTYLLPFAHELFTAGEGSVRGAASSDRDKGRGARFIRARGYGIIVFVT
jgi:hypothetical protein